MYTEFYGFSEKPFSVTPDPKFLFETPMHREALASMIYGITERRGFVVITGEVGTGKTTLIHTLFNRFEENVKAAFIFHTSITFVELLKNILDELSIPIDDPSKMGMHRTLNAYLVKKLAQDEIIAVIIDEAQNLSREVMEDLRMLSNLETNKSKLLQIVLVGQPELERQLQSEDLRQLRQRIWLKCRIQPLTEQESREYIGHRLSLVGSSAKIFTTEALSMISQYAGGVPRTINVICENALLVGYAKSQRKIDGHIINEVLQDMEDFVMEKQMKPSTHTHMVSRSPYQLKSTFYARSALGILTGLCIALGALLVYQWYVPMYYTNYSQVTRTKSTPAIKNGIPEATVAPDKSAAVDPVPPQPLTPESASSPQAASAGAAQPVKESEELMDAASRQATQPLNIPAIKNKIPEATVASNEPASVETAPSQPREPGSASNPQAASAGAAQPVKVPAKLIEAEPLGDSIKENSQGNIVTIERDNCISNLAKKNYQRSNATLISIILDANPFITDANMIRIKQRIKIPEITKDTLLIAGQDSSYRIHLGTFESPYEAKRYQDEEILKGKKIKIIPRKISPQGTWYRIEASAFNSRDESLQVIQALQQKGLLPALGDFSKPLTAGNP
jgi:general secretion pathway protein A